MRRLSYPIGTESRRAWTPTNANTALASAFVEELARCGLRHAVVSPGSRSTPLAVALWRQPEIEVTVIVDERSAAFFALGAAQASGAPVAMLCTSGTAAANFHPAICEADESALPLIALTADRPPELRGIGAGQTLDQIKLYGSAVRWFCEVGTHEADDDGLLHYRATACRAFAAARGEPRPGPVHLNLPWREPLAPTAVEGAVTATDELALEGRGGRPLTAVTPIDLEPSGFLLEEVAKHIAEAISGVIVAGRQLDPELREPLAHLAETAGFPILAEPTSQIRCGPHDRSHVIANYDLLLRDEHFRNRSVPDLVLRFGEMPTSKPLRTWLAASGADQIVVDPHGGWNEPTRRAAAILRADPTELAAGWAARVERGDRENAELWRRADDAASAARRGRARRRGGDHRAGAAPGARRRAPRRRPRLHRLEHADPRPGGVPARRGDRRPLPLQPGRERHRRPDLLGDRRRRGERQADDDRHRRPRPPPRHRRPGRPARGGDPGPDRRHRQRRRRHLPLPAPGRGAGRRGVRGPARHARAGSAPRRPPTSSTFPTGSWRRSPSCPMRSPPAPG